MIFTAITFGIFSAYTRPRLGKIYIDQIYIYNYELMAKTIFVHNHPSGSPEPSRADIQITNRISEAGRLLGIVVHDHLVIGRHGYVSLKAKGLL